MLCKTVIKRYTRLAKCCVRLKSNDIQDLPNLCKTEIKRYTRLAKFRVRLKSNDIQDLPNVV